MIVLVTAAVTWPMTASAGRAIIGQMDRDGLTIVPEASEPLVRARAGEPTADRADNHDATEATEATEAGDPA